MGIGEIWALIGGGVPVDEETALRLLHEYLMPEDEEGEEDSENGVFAE